MTAMLAKELEISLHGAFVDARLARHEAVTVEHLLLALLANPSAAEVLKACACDIEDLRKNLQHFIADNTAVLPPSSGADAQPTPGLKRAVEIAILHGRTFPKREVTGVDVLIAISGEKNSHAAHYLRQAGVTRLDIFNYVSHGVRKGLQGRADVIRGAGTDDRRQDPAERPDTAEVAVAIDQELEVSLHSAFAEARQARHEVVTVEHVLLALLDNPSAAAALEGRARNIEDLRKNLRNFIANDTPVLAHDSEADAKPTLGFQRVIQRAVIRAHSASRGKRAVTGAHVLVEILGEKDSHALYFLVQQGVTRLDILDFISGENSK